MRGRYPRSILYTLCLSIILAVAATILVNDRQLGADGFHDKARTAPATMDRPRASGVL